MPEAWLFSEMPGASRFNSFSLSPLFARGHKRKLSNPNAFGISDYSSGRDSLHQ
jgi:hypothetical protein